MFKSEKGITLVALVITIVILIILATVSISFAVNGGLFDKAQAGAGLYSNAAFVENQELKSVETKVNDIWSSLNIVIGD